MTKKSALSTEEAIELINLLKRKVINQTYYIPNGKGRFEFEVVSDDDQSFVVNVQRKGINADNCTYLGRLTEGIVLLRLELVFIAKKWYNRRYEKRISSNKLRK